MGYKDTPFGRIPENWGIAPISEITETVTDYVANGSFASLAENVIYKETEDVAVLIRLADYNNNFNGKFVFIDEHAYQFLAKSKLYGGEIIISNVGANVGTVFRCPRLPYKMSLAPNAIMVKFKESNDFYYFWLKSHAGQHMLHSIVTGSAQPKFNKTNFRDMVVPIPPLQQQKKIACILKVLEDKLALNQQINKNLEEQLNIVYHQIFDKEKDFLELGAAIKTTSGGTPARKQEEFYRDAHICWVKSKELAGGYIFDTEEKINDIAIKKSSAKILPTHSVLIAMYGATVGEFAIIAKPMACNQAICALLDSDTYPYTYLYQFIKEEKAHLLNMAVGSAQQNISQILIKQLPIHANTEKVKEFHSLVKPIHEQKEALGKECTVLSDLRDALLPRLMSGEIDVSKIEI